MNAQLDLSPLPPDYHMHTRLCRHAEGIPHDYAAQAVRIGLDEIGFSDHAPMPRDDFDDWRMTLAELAQYVEWVRQAQRDFPNLQIRLGIEIDYLPGHEEWICELIQKAPWDYIIGSVHYVADGWDVDNPAKRSEWDHHDPWQVWTVYFERLIRATESGCFDIIGHADLPKKFGIHPRQDCVPLYRRFLEAARRSDVAIELNTAGLRKDCAEIYPGPVFLRLARETGVPITFGSDAHRPGEVGLQFGAAVALARDCGYREYGRFCRRRRQMTILPVTC
jgi:histidinol-phosphatase (PHP family)